MTSTVTGGNAQTAPRGPGAVQHTQLYLPARPESLPTARHAVRTALSEWGLADRGGLQDNALVVITELLGNALRHAVPLIGGSETPCLVVQLAVDEDRLFLAVTDGSPTALPSVRQAADGDENDRGLALIDALAASWGCSTDRQAKTVWAALRLPPRPRRSLRPLPDRLAQ
ncbi:ATP-binding protein [Streptomyces litchfieldiae]|uniref:ATP-binding protein n=1 Tax=Streptomyces litchfieldiae TaxID=3075543 RepID=A0ABU2MVX7_9ACTN|nr:ATP-binding protein [Streptomyces sp. DSM 44938]MDT0345801.1 ATP-binding protein [Streptomyces sp. DSM 44938]